jgi:lipopolysaccharide export system permease protein
MKRLHFFIIQSFIGPFIITFGIAMFFLVMQFLWKYIDDFMGKGLEMTVMFELLFYVSATLIPLALPLAVLFSSIMTFGNLAEHNELTALKSAGMSLSKVMRPMLIFIFMLSVGAFYFSNYVLPIANLKWRALIWNIQEKKPTFSLTPKIFYNEIDGYSIRVDKKNDNTAELEGVLIYENNMVTGGKVIRAKEGEMLKSENERYLLIRLMDGAIYENIGNQKYANAQHPYQKSKFEEAIMKLDMSGFQMEEESEDLFARDYEMMNFRQLDYALDSLYKKADTVQIHFEASVLRRFVILDTAFNKALPTDSIQGVNGELEAFTLVDTVIYLDSLHSSEMNMALAAAQANIRNYKDISYTSVMVHGAMNSTFIDYKAAWHKKFTLSFAILVLFFIGAPLGAIVKKGGLGTPLVFATLFFLFYYILTITGENMVESEVISPAWGMWLSSVVLAPLGIFLTYKAANDSALFDWEAYKRFFSKFKR